MRNTYHGMCNTYQGMRNASRACVIPSRADCGIFCVYSTSADDALWPTGLKHGKDFDFENPQSLLLLWTYYTFAHS